MASCAVPPWPPEVGFMSSWKRGLWLGAIGVVLMGACASHPGDPGVEPSPGQTLPGSGGEPDDAAAMGGSSGSAGSGGGTSGGGSGSSGASSGSIGSSSGASGSGSGAGMTAGPPPDGGSTCPATVASNAIPLSGNYLSAGTVGKGGYAYSYEDGKGSTACMTSAALCGKGSTAVADAAGTIWGAGIGINLNQAAATTSASPAVDTTQATGTGVQYALSNLPPQGMRIVIDSGGTDYCAPIGSASGIVYWSSFNTKCWDDSGTALTGPPATATHLLFQITADAASTPFDVCVTGVSFATTSAPPPDAGNSSSGGGGNGTGGCTWPGGPASGNGGGELTCYWFGQGTSKGGGCSSYKTYCGYCGTESGGGGGTCPSGISDSVSNVATSYFAAFPVGSFGQGKYCGMCVDVSYGGKTITATIVDECATCNDSGGHIDLSLSAAVALGIGQGGASGNPKSGVTWTSVACPVTGDIVAVFNGSSSQIYFENVAFPVASASAGGSAAGQSTGFWTFGTVVGGKAVTLTDTLGHTIHGTIPTGSGGSIGAQFPATCN
jgi:hypothetical protein